MLLEKREYAKCTSMVKPNQLNKFLLTLIICIVNCKNDSKSRFRNFNNMFILINPLKQVQKELELGFHQNHKFIQFQGNVTYLSSNRDDLEILSA